VREYIIDEEVNQEGTQTEPGDAPMDCSKSNGFARMEKTRACGEEKKKLWERPLGVGVNASGGGSKERRRNKRSREGIQSHGRNGQAWDGANIYPTGHGK